MPAKLTPFVPLTIPDLRPMRDLGTVPEQRWLSIDKLVVDEAYQRPLGKEGLANIAQIAELFDWRKFGPVVVSPVEGGQYAVVDGQHRTHAALLCGASHVPCLIIQANGREQAQAFAAINGNVTKIQRVSLLKAKLAAGDPELTKLDALAKDCGISIIWHNIQCAKMLAAETCAIPALCRLMLEGDEVFRLVTVAILACKFVGASNLTAFWFEAFANVLGDHAEWCNEPLITQAFAKVSLSEELTKIHLARKADPRVSRKAWAESMIVEKLNAAAKKQAKAVA